MRGGHALAKFAAAFLLLFGVWQAGQGIYIKAKAALAQVLLESAWEETLTSGAETKPWPWFDTYPVAKVEVPRLQEEAIVLRGASGQAMAFGPGHMEGTPTPGERGLSIIAAHRDTHFEFLQHVEVGDQITITNEDGTLHVFRVTGSAIKNANNSGLDPYGSGTRVALVTCYPFDAMTQSPLRYVVFAEEIEI